MVRTPPSNAGAVGSIPSQGAKIAHASWPKTKARSRSNTVTASIKTLKKKKKRAMDLNRPFPKEDTEMANKYLKEITNITGHDEILLHIHYDGLKEKRKEGLWRNRNAHELLAECKMVPPQQETNVAVP